jgi:hypothetical protein
MENQTHNGGGLSSHDLFCLFAGHPYYPEGGAEDFRGFGSVESLKALYAEHSEKWAKKAGGYDSRWGQIVEHATMKIAWSIYDDEEWEFILFRITKRP